MDPAQIAACRINVALRDIEDEDWHHIDDLLRRYKDDTHFLLIVATALKEHCECRPKMPKDAGAQPTLRDHLAMHALAALVKRGTSASGDTAEEAYEYADAMLYARDK